MSPISKLSLSILACSLLSACATPVPQPPRGWINTTDARIPADHYLAVCRYQVDSVPMTTHPFAGIIYQAIEDSNNTRARNNLEGECMEAAGFKLVDLS